jgi:hypothetical protein
LHEKWTAGRGCGQARRGFIDLFQDNNNTFIAARNKSWRSASRLGSIRLEVDGGAIIAALVLVLAADLLPDTRQIFWLVQRRDRMNRTILLLFAAALVPARRGVCPRPRQDQKGPIPR